MADSAGERAAAQPELFNGVDEKMEVTKERSSPSGSVDQPSKEEDETATQQNEKPAAAKPEKPKKPGIFKRIWTFLDLDVMTVCLMFKASLPPTIATALYQYDGFATQYSTLGYLVSISSILGFCKWPTATLIDSQLRRQC